MRYVLITFDLIDAETADYELVYAAAHLAGGTRYFPFGDGTWGRLPSTTIVVPVVPANDREVQLRFSAFLLNNGLRHSHILVQRTDCWLPVCVSERIEETQVPLYARPQFQILYDALGRAGLYRLPVIDCLVPHQKRHPGQGPATPLQQV